MKSIRLVLGAFVVTLHLHQPIESAASEPPKASRIREVLVPKTTPEIAIPFDEQMTFAPVSDMAYTGKEFSVQTIKNGTIVGSRTIAEANNFMPINSSLSTHHASINKQTPAKKGAGWRRVCEGRTCLEPKPKHGKDNKNRRLSSRWIQHDDIPVEKDTFLTQRTPYLAASSTNLLQQIAQKNEALERIAYEKQQMLDVIKRRVLHEFTAYSICIGYSLECNKIYKAQVERELAPKKAEKQALDMQLSACTASALQKQFARRNAEIKAHWAPTEEMSSLEYASRYAAYHMTAPSAMTIDEAIQAEFQSPNAKKQHVALLIAHAKKIWPTLEAAPTIQSNVPHDIAAQELLIRDLKEQQSQSRTAEEKESLSTKIVAEATRLQELKLLHFIKSLQCDANVRHIEQSYNALNQQIAFLEEHAAQSETRLRALLPIALYEARERGLEPTAAIQQVFSMPHEAAEFLSYFYTRNDNLDEAATDQEIQENCLEQALQKKYADMQEGTMSDYENYLTHNLHQRNVTLIKEKAEESINKVLEKKLLDVKELDAKAIETKAVIESDYARHLPYMNTHHVQAVIRKHGARLEACLQKKNVNEQASECAQTLYELPGYTQ